MIFLQPVITPHARLHGATSKFKTTMCGQHIKLLRYWEPVTHSRDDARNVRHSLIISPWVRKRIVATPQAIATVNSNL